MFFEKRDPEEESLEKIRSGVQEFEKNIDYKEKELSNLFLSLKQNILSSDPLDMRHVHILKKQVSHILSVARAVNYKELESAFEQESDVLSHIEDLFEKFPRIEVTSSSDLQAAVRNLRSMLSAQQDLIFRHEEIMQQEKHRLILILQEAQELEKEVRQEHSLRPEVSARILH